MQECTEECTETSPLLSQHLKQSLSLAFYQILSNVFILQCLQITFNISSYKLRVDSVTSLFMSPNKVKRIASTLNSETLNLLLKCFSWHSASSFMLNATLKDDNHVLNSTICTRTGITFPLSLNRRSPD